MRAAATAIGRDHFVWALATLCRMHGVAFDPALLLQQFPPPHTLASLASAAHTLGFRADLHPVRADRMRAVVPPFLLVCAGEPALVVSAAGEEDYGVLVPQDREPKMRRAAALVPDPHSALVAFARDAEPLDAHADGTPAGRRFGFAWFVPELLRHRATWRDVLLASAAIQLLGLGTPLLTQVVIDKVVVHQSMNTLMVIAIALVIAVAFTAAMSWSRQLLVLYTGNRIDAVLGVRVFEHLLQLPPRYFEQRPTGTLVARVQGIETIREFLSSAAIALILDLPFLALYLGILFWYSWQLALVVGALLGLIVAISALVAPLVRSRLNRQFLLGARNQALLTEYLAAIETVKSLQMEPQLERRFQQQLQEYLAAGLAMRQLANSYGVASGALEQLLTLLVLCLGAWMVMQNAGFTIGMLVAFQMVTGRLSQPVLRMVGLWQELQQAGIAVRRLGDIMDAPPEPRSCVPSGADAGSPRAVIAFEGLGFRHSDVTPYLYRNLTLHIAPGSCVAVMGPSGSGKSTLARLLQGFYFPTEGVIRVAGRDTRSLPSNELRCHFGVVPQETVLFSGTVYDNLVPAGSEVAFDDVAQACRFAEIHEVIEAMPCGYQTRIGEHGSGLSVGQKQRLAMARALLRRAPVLVFDEATASLDARVADQLARTISALRGKVTILFIAHQIPPGLIVDETVLLGGPS